MDVKRLGAPLTQAFDLKSTRYTRQKSSRPALSLFEPPTYQPLKKYEVQFNNTKEKSEWRQKNAKIPPPKKSGRFPH
jgi:hypothetical protein